MFLEVLVILSGSWQFFEALVPLVVSYWFLVVLCCSSWFLGVLSDSLCFFVLLQILIVFGSS